MEKGFPPNLDPENYVLPDAIPALIAKGQKSAREEILKLPDPTDPMQLAKVFRYFHKSFCTASRHNLNDKEGEPVEAGLDPEILSSSDRRVNFHAIIKAAAAVCYIGAILHQFPNPEQDRIVAYMHEEWPPLFPKFSDGTIQPPIKANPFYCYYTEGVLHYRLTDWLPRVLAESIVESEKAVGTEATCLAALQEVFVTGDSLQAFLANVGEVSNSNITNDERPLGAPPQRAAGTPHFT